MKLVPPFELSEILWNGSLYQSHYVEITDKFTISIFYQFYLYCLVQVLQTTLADNPTDYNGPFTDKVYLSSFNYDGLYNCGGYKYGGITEKPQNLTRHS